MMTSVKMEETAAIPTLTALAQLTGWEVVVILVKNTHVIYLITFQRDYIKC